MNKKTIYFLMLSCKKATQLMEKRSLTELSLVESVRLGLHKKLCDACSNYEKQSKFIDQALLKYLNDNNSVDNINNELLKEKIISKL